MPNSLPDAISQMTSGVISTRSVAELEKLTAAPLGPVASATTRSGTVNWGGVVSRTVTWKLPDAVLPLSSLTVQPTVVSPSPNVLPGTGVHMGMSGPSTSSSALTENGTTAPNGPLASCTI